MGQKVNPRSFQLGGLKGWNSKWFSKKTFSQLLKSDILIRKFLKEKFKKTGIAKVEIERSIEKVRVSLYTTKPGLIIGRAGKGAEELKKQLQGFLPKGTILELVIRELEQKLEQTPQVTSQLILEDAVSDIEKRVPYRRVLKRALEQGKKAGVRGIRVSLKGRLDGIEIAREEHLSWGKMPLGTLRANIDYTRGTAYTTYGTIGVKVWVCK